MNIRALNPLDINELKEIHELYFKDEFSFPSFLQGYHCAFVVEDEHGIIAAAGVRPIAEVVLITNKEPSPIKKFKALTKILQASEFIGKRFGYDSIHAFVQEEGWQKHLMTRANFKPTKGQSLFLEI